GEALPMPHDIIESVRQFEWIRSTGQDIEYWRVLCHGHQAFGCVDGMHNQVGHPTKHRTCALYQSAIELRLLCQAPGSSMSKLLDHGHAIGLIREPAKPRRNMFFAPVDATIQTLFGLRDVSASGISESGCGTVYAAGSAAYPSSG